MPCRAESFGTAGAAVWERRSSVNSHSWRDITYGDNFLRSAFSLTRNDRKDRNDRARGCTAHHKTPFTPADVPLWFRYDRRKRAIIQTYHRSTCMAIVSRNTIQLSYVQGIFRESRTNGVETHGSERIPRLFVIVTSAYSAWKRRFQNASFRDRVGYAGSLRRRPLIAGGRSQEEEDTNVSTRVSPKASRSLV